MVSNTVPQCNKLWLKVISQRKKHAHETDQYSRIQVELLAVVRDGPLVAMGDGRQETVEELCVEEKKWVSGEGRLDAQEKAGDWWRSRHHDLCLAHLLPGVSILRYIHIC